eukprot:CAMPEP_0114412538 /NCGR_PEP_ID=MMETSP0103-20121206/381_1 /TAXON_ID=37642 ORGANISM="Paraphysomonas imperforata, Strain PA2" /NCGR_SAMPLE_ID=MMETSP0103 /ASSEMBLY_ACC=CAM_ASM_000201 /LENGTH=73 /DNA_ID=CAMNT_0001580565 /DNA_START=251 /DNA_END=472 /DNA_ORIENTATION=-
MTNVVLDLSVTSPSDPIDSVPGELAAEHDLEKEATATFRLETVVVVLTHDRIVQVLPDLGTSERSSKGSGHSV